MVLKISDTPFPPFLLKKDKLFSYDEVIQLIKMYGAPSTSRSLSAFKILFKYFETREIVTPYQAWLLYENEHKKSIKTEDDFNKLYTNNHKVFETYLILLMSFSRIPIDRNFISEFYIYNSGLKHNLIWILMENFYNLTKPDAFPKMSDLENLTNRRFIFSLNAFYKISDLTEETIIKEFLIAISLDTYRKTGIFKNIIKFQKTGLLEFIDKIYPKLITLGIMERKDNIYAYLRSIIYPPMDNVQKLRVFLNKKIKELNGTEMGTLLHSYVENNIITINGKEELQWHINHLKTNIKCWCDLSLIAIEDGVEKIEDITSEHRDLWLYENNGIDGKRLLRYIPPILKFYNEVIQEHTAYYYDTSIFSTKWSPNIGKDINHTPLQGAAFGQIISAIAHKISETRKKGLVNGVINEEKFCKNLHTRETQNFLYEFFIYRLIWFVLLTGRRVKEIRQLNLARVKNSLSLDDKYVYIRTAKGNFDRKEEFDRGQLNENGNYEFDYIHIDVFKEVINVAEFVYKGTGVPIKDQFLFPSVARDYNEIKSVAIGNYLKDIQIEYDIVHGSPVDFRNKLMYASSPEWKKLIGKPLFSLHHLRHAYIHTIHTNANLTLEQVVLNIGHRNNKSIGAYTKIFANVFQVFKTLEDEGHIGAGRELVSAFYKEANGIENKNAYIILTNFLDFLKEFKVETSLISINPEANRFPEVDSDCVTTISCGDTGMGCLRCNDFRAGKLTLTALLSVSTIFDKEFRNIDGAIDQINKRKKEIIKVNRKDDKRIEVIHNLFTPLIDKFKAIIEARQITLLSQETGFGFSEKEADKLISKIWKRARKLNLDEDIVKYIKKSKKSGMFSHIDFTLYRSAANREVFKVL
ncbi:hypothetical protein [Bacillus sp. AFS088145]|uniref:hypothetical protein n=1 Tax=Bacillus sp. AFS088145 TaxID=2033514 RepID=UPI000BFAB09F|nr:hypothetical protein [Bacillus sp. AFS088145]PFH92657.1 hypothetical protein COI44_00255 [Bacillus sp. AFS088145]